MSEHINSLPLYENLLEDAIAKDHEHQDGLAVSVVPPLFPRRDGVSVFAEGEQFAGAERRGNAEAFVTMVAFPHLPATLEQETMLDHARRVLPREPGPPEGAEEAKFISPQLMVWWRMLDGKEEDGRADISTLIHSSAEQQADASEAIASQLGRAVEILQAASDMRPTIWGCWGHATPEERSTEGRGRGAPTNKHGHIHVSTFEHGDANDIRIEEGLSASEKLDHYEPWVAVFHEVTGVPLARMIESSLTDASNHVTAMPFSEPILREDGTSTYRYGYTLEFEQPITGQETVASLIKVAEKMDSLYQSVGNHYEQYHLNWSPGRTSAEPEQTRSLAVTEGFTESEADALVDLVFSIKPTYGQLLNWREELSSSDRDEQNLARIERLIERYERVGQRLGNSPNTENSMARTLILHTVTNPDDFASIKHVWPVHSSFFFTIDGYEARQGDVAVKSLQLFPSIGTTASAVEHKTGAVVVRK